MWEFVKMHGCANDYLFVEVQDDSGENDRRALAVAMSDRRRGVGADGVIFVAPSTRAVAAMWMYNADGTRGAMCGNGLRCVAKYVRDTGRTNEDEFDIETDVGLRTCRILEHGDRRTLVQVDMGRPVTEPQDIPVLSEAGSPTHIVDLMWHGQRWAGHAVSMGNPHVVFFCGEPVRLIDLEAFAGAVRATERFPEDVNIEVVRVLDLPSEHPTIGRCEVRTHERGSGETHACGSGACAVAFVANTLGLVPAHVEIDLLGGTLRIDVGETLCMTGPAERVFCGTWGEGV